MSFAQLLRDQDLSADAKAVLQPLATDECRSTCRRRFGSPLVLSRVHWVRPERVAEVKFLTWTEDNLPRHSSMKGCAKTSRRKRCGVRWRI